MFKLDLDGKQTDALKHVALGAIGGALALLIIGQYWPGYMLDSSASAEVEKGVRDANAKSATVLCQVIYQAAPDSKVKLAELRAMDEYRARQDSGVSAAAAKAVETLKAAGIEPPSKWSFESNCANALHKPPEKTAQLK